MLFMNPLNNSVHLKFAVLSGGILGTVQLIALPGDETVDIGCGRGGGCCLEAWPAG
jgi:hypothetical protein